MSPPRLASAAARIAAAGREGDARKVLRIFEKAKPKTDHVYSAAIAACGRARNWRAGVAIFEDLQQLDVKRLQSCHNSALSAASAGAQWTWALQLLAAHDSPDQRSYTSALTACTRAQRWKHGLEVLDMMVEGQAATMDLPAAVAAMTCLGLAGDGDGAVNILRTYLTAADKVIKVEAYNACITACCRAEAVAAAQQLLAEVDMHKLEKSRATHFAALQVYELGADWEKALDVLVALQATGEALSASDFTRAIGACGRGLKWQAALQLLASASACGANDAACQNAAITACSRSGQWLAALGLLLEMAALRTTVSWNSAITACAEAAEWQAALGMLGSLRMPSSAAGADTISYNATISACSNAGRWQEAIQVFDDMVEGIVAPDPSTLTSLVAACERGGQPEIALTMFERIQEHRVLPTAPAYNAALLAAGRSSAWEPALALLGAMEVADVERGQRTCSAVLRACHRAGRYHEATSALARFRGLLDPGFIEYMSAQLEAWMLDGMDKPAENSFWHGSDAMQLEAEPVAAGRGGIPPPLPAHLPDVPAELPRPADGVENSVELVKAMVRSAIAGADVWPLGSAAEGLRSAGSDIDLTVVLPEDTPDRHVLTNGVFEEQRDVRHRTLRKLRPALAEIPGLHVTALILEGRMPILRLVLPCGSPADLSVEHRAGCRKSSLVHQHLAASEALRRCCFLLKTWAQHRGVYGQLRGYPSGFAYACLGICAGQRIQPAAASLLRPEDVPPFADGGTKHVSVVPTAAIDSSRGCGGDVLGDDAVRLLWTVFVYYGQMFDWEREMVSITRRTSQC
eukprot:TRINITY_DN47453_c0_g1_i1.p1 TRINITY_DN47453_c0_g1~~TRINITY_DN47453_c0_g1_i1.p1  ORF type:complete len:805 (+),score=163.63 TRINITY_DN47453_c0_g1_i1:189-2603(+)